MTISQARAFVMRTKPFLMSKLTAFPCRDLAKMPARKLTKYAAELARDRKVVEGVESWPDLLTPALYWAAQYEMRMRWARSNPSRSHSVSSRSMTSVIWMRRECYARKFLELGAKGKPA